MLWAPAFLLLKSTSSIQPAVAEKKISQSDREQESAAMLRRRKNSKQNKCSFSDTIIWGLGKRPPTAFKTYPDCWYCLVNDGDSDINRELLG